MFFYFFEEYKENIYKGSRRKLKWYEIILLSAIIIFTLLFLLAFTLKWGTTVTTVLFSVLLLLVAFVWIHTNRDLKKNRESLLNGYKGKHIEPLCQRLIGYNIYTDNGIELLIDCCKEQRQRNRDFTLLSTIKKFFMSVIYPLITLALGLVLKDSAADDITSFIAVLIVIFIVGGGTILCLQSIALFMLFPDKNIVDYLEEDLKYIKTQIKDKQQ